MADSSLHMHEHDYHEVLENGKNDILEINVLPIFKKAGISISGFG